MPTKASYVYFDRTCPNIFLLPRTEQARKGKKSWEHNTTRCIGSPRCFTSSSSPLVRSRNCIALGFERFDRFISTVNPPKLVAVSIALPESHSLVAVKVHPAVKFNLELKFILGDQDEPQAEIANELSI